MCKSRSGYWKLWRRCDSGSKRLSFQGSGSSSASVWMDIHRNEAFEKTVNDSDSQIGLFLIIITTSFGRPWKNMIDVLGCRHSVSIQL